ncbi:MAG: cytochrome C oxidase subunit IV family protein [Actinomycetes bacterium]
MSETITAPATTGEIAPAEHHLLEGASDLEMLPGELHPHPSPFQYVMIAVVLCVITAAEVGAYYLDKSVSKGAITAILVFGAVAKFFIVTGWYMHLKTDAKIFRRFFILGVTGAFFLFTIVLLTLSGLADV